MTSAKTWFDSFWAEVRKTSNWKTMEQTVEASEWHREANVAVHTTMCIDHYFETTAPSRTQREQILTAVTLLFHDFGKPEAEETIEKKDGSGETYHRYAGHEPVSANEFLSFMCDHPELTKSFFARGFDWGDVRKIKWMIENHLPYGIKNANKRENLKAAMENTLGGDVQCFYDQLWSDCNGRISDDHETKRQNVINWIAEWREQKAAKPNVIKPNAPTMYVLQGPVGVGKTTWTASLRGMNRSQEIVVVSEDNYRMEFALAHFNDIDHAQWTQMDVKRQYATAWQFCFDHSKDYDKYAKEQLRLAVATGKTLVLDRTNQTRKSRSPWIQAAKQAGYKIHSIEFYASEALSAARQKTRADKDVPYNRLHQIYMAFDVPMLGVEVDAFDLITPF